MHSLLVQYGYKQTAKDRFLSPNSTSKLAGVKVFDDGRAFSHHASDPFSSEHSFDCFELWCQYEFQGNVTKAVREAAAFLHIKQEPEADEKEIFARGTELLAKMTTKPKPKPDAGPLDHIPDHLLAIPGILQDVVNGYSISAIKPQPQFAVQCAIAFGSVVMGRRWVTDRRNFSSLYLLNIGETGSGKEHTKTVLGNNAGAGWPDRPNWPRRLHQWCRRYVHPHQQASPRQRGR